MKLTVTIEHDPDAPDARTLSVQGPICYQPHFDRNDQDLPNHHYQPHVHVPVTDTRGRAVTIVWEDRDA